MLGNRGTERFISGEQRNMYNPHPWEGLFYNGGVTLNFVPIDPRDNNLMLKTDHMVRI